MKISDIFTPASIAAFWAENPSNRVAYLGEGLFPAQQKAGLDLRWIKGSHGLPVSLMPSAFDAQATFRDRPGLEITETEMPFFREGFKIKERDRQELLRISEMGDPYLQQVLLNLYNDAAELIDGANVVAERERMQLLFPISGNMGITIKGNGVDYTYNYDPDGAWKSGNYFELSGTALWSATATADPFKDIRTAKRAVNAKTGSTPVYAVMNSTTFDLLGSISAVKNRFLTVAGLTVGYLTDDQIAELLRSTVGVSPVVYDKQYKDESGTVGKYVPDGYVALVPDGAIGKTVYGVTPEQADLFGNEAAKSLVSIVNTGVAITQTMDEHPVNVNTFASEIVLPSYERMDEVALLKVT
ncbi:MAG: major capsid protein [Oscillospiraceae bacterium]|nr:major capsid protein [Oscillospiraceae bacterium]